MRLRTSAPVLLLLAACEAGSLSGSPAAQPVHPAAVALPLAQPSGVQRPSGPVLSKRPLTPPVIPMRVSSSTALLPAGTHTVSDVDSVVARVEVSGVEGTHQVAVEFYAPTGEAFARQEATLEGKATDVQVAELSLPVRGTHISEHTLAGAWTTKVLLDGKHVAVDGFTLQR